MALNTTYRVVHCKQYDNERKLQEEWWEVQCYKSKWWSFGKRWFTEMTTLCSSGGDFDVPTKFRSDQDAFEYIGRVSANIPKNTVTRTPITHFI